MQEEFGPRAVAFGRAMAEISGHYRVALELYLAADQPAALLHASHPLMEVLPVVYEDLLEHGSAADLARALGVAATAIRERRSAQDVNQAFESVTRLGVAALADVVGPAAMTLPYASSVVAALVRSAGSKYRLALDGGRVSLQPEYEDAYGFVRQAARMIEGWPNAAEFQSGIEELEQLIPGPLPPDEPTPLDRVETVARGFRESLARAAGALLRETPTPAEAVDRLEYRLALLADILDHGETGRAEKLVTRMYAEDLRDLEEPLTEAAPDIAADLGERLAGMRVAINRGASRADLAPEVRRIQGLLAEGLIRLKTSNQQG
ncbi:MAG TPA: hypothetical protein VNP73_06895 [Actinomycetota bacterium]|nr:hypothetical protein [Actinomycetota bacterium]